MRLLCWQEFWHILLGADTGIVANWVPIFMNPKILSAHYIYEKIDLSIEKKLWKRIYKITKLRTCIKIVISNVHYAAENYYY